MIIPKSLILDSSGPRRCRGRRSAAVPCWSASSLASSPSPTVFFLLFNDFDTSPDVRQRRLPCPRRRCQRRPPQPGQTSWGSVTFLSSPTSSSSPTPSQSSPSPSSPSPSSPSPSSPSPSSPSPPWTQSWWKSCSGLDAGHVAHYIAEQEVIALQG